MLSGSFGRFKKGTICFNLNFANDYVFHLKFTSSTVLTSFIFYRSDNPIVCSNIAIDLTDDGYLSSAFMSNPPVRGSLSNVP